MHEMIVIAHNKLDGQRACRTEPRLSDATSRDAHKQQIDKI